MPTPPRIIATWRGVERSPSETMSVVAQAGEWTVSVPIIAQLVSMIETVALAVSRNPAIENGGSDAVIETSGAMRTHANKPAIDPIAWLPIPRCVRPRCRSNARTNAVGPRLGKTNGCPLPHAITPRTVNNSPAYKLVPTRCRIVAVSNRQINHPWFVSVVLVGTTVQRYVSKYPKYMSDGCDTLVT
jgi:hypothetical protein